MYGHRRGISFGLTSRRLVSKNDQCHDVSLVKEMERRIAVRRRTLVTTQGLECPVCNQEASGGECRSDTHSLNIRALASSSRLNIGYCDHLCDLHVTTAYNDFVPMVLQTKREVKVKLNYREEQIKGLALHMNESKELQEVRWNDISNRH